MIDLFNKLTKRHNPHQIFNDFLELTSLAISNSTDYKNRNEREIRYLEVSRKYNPEELKIFTEILAKLSIELESPKDILGELLMKLEEGNSTKGQYLTPFHICKMTASIAFDEEKLKQDGYLVVNEPSAGGGALIIALYVVMKEKGYDPQSQLKVIANDLDLKAVFMCYIQMALLGVQAKVQHQNAMTGEIFSIWKTPNWILSLCDYL
ncbi:MAG: N-6 DNA methylase [Clostridium sp.]